MRADGRIRFGILALIIFVSLVSALENMFYFDPPPGLCDACQLADQVDS